jgi:hypothetical protein
MQLYSSLRCRTRVSTIPEFVILSLVTGILLLNATGNSLLYAQESSPSTQASPPQRSESQTQETSTQEQQPQEQPAPASGYDKAIFQKPIPADQLTFLNRFEGQTANDLIRDKQFRKLMHNVIPNCMFHYGHDMPLTEAIETVLKGSSLPVHIRDGRYLILSGNMGPYLVGRGFIWIDLQDGIVLGGFYFHPTNGEPTPAVNVFSNQVSEEFIALSQLPPAFAEDMSRWSANSRVPTVTTRYFINGANRKVLLEHDEDYCATVNGVAMHSASDCQQMNADAADIDMDAASYLEQTNHATNATAWMITGQDQIAWLRVRDNTCRIGVDPLLCRIRITRERVHVIIGRRPVGRPGVRVTRK